MVSRMARSREMPPAERFIQDLGDRVMEVLSRAGAGEAARMHGVEEILAETVDLDTIARIVLGRNWQRCSDVQRRDYIGLFRAYTLSTLSQRLSSSTGSERFVVTGSRTAGGADSMVTARILYTDYPPMQIDWRVRKGQQELTLIDVVVEQISLVVTNRSEFDSIVGQRGIDGLLQELRVRVNGS
jgi:phospholipid transport system substrate-binding protein